MVGHLQLQGMENSTKEKNKESLLDSPDSGLPPSPSPPFYSLSPGTAENKAVISEQDHGPTRDAQEGKLQIVFDDHQTQLLDTDDEVKPQEEVLGPPEDCLEAREYLLNFKEEVSLMGQIPYVLLNASAFEIRPRMCPIFFGESIEVNPDPVQEIRCNSEIKYGSERHYRDDVFYHPVPTITTYRETVVVAPNCTWRSYKSQLFFEPRQKPLRFQSTTIIFPKRAKNLYRTTLNYRLGSAKRWFASSVQLALCEENFMYPENLP